MVFGVDISMFYREIHEPHFLSDVVRHLRGVPLTLTTTMSHVRTRSRGSVERRD